MKKKTQSISDGLFSLASGRAVMLEELYVRQTELGILAGTSESIREDVLRCLPVEIDELFCKSAFILREPPRGPLPAYIYFAHLISHKPLHPDGDFSSLAVCWFSDSLTESVHSCVASQLDLLDWDTHAKDGRY